MPQSVWNGRLLGTGNGGFAGAIRYKSLADGVKRGYAVANTDMGTAVPQGTDAGIFADRPERWIDFGYRSTHEMTLLAKRLINTYYGQSVQKAYFQGCSTGGQQALMEAQRFPEDYDGIVGGAAANNRTGVHISILWNFGAMHRNLDAAIPAPKLRLLGKAVLENCKGFDGDGVNDNLLVDPRKCLFDPASLKCKGTDQDGCLTAAQVETARLLYAGPSNLNSKDALYPGLPPGSEFGWDYYEHDLTPNAEPPFLPIFRWAFGPIWTWHSFDFDKQAASYSSRLSKSVNATSPDLDEFRRQGHKLLIYHGWADWLVAPGEAVNYYNLVLARYGSSAGVENFYRLFMLPGVGHCSGGPGADGFDALSAIVNWVENGVAPDRIVATKYGQDRKVLFQRPLCPFPEIARYRGTGDVNDVDSFVCATPERTTTE